MLRYGGCPTDVTAIIPSHRIEIGMTISLSPEYEKLIQQKVQSGEFPTAEAVVEFALNRLIAGSQQTPGIYIGRAGTNTRRILR